MKMPNIWGQGQLFAFSALDGESYMSDDFAGMLAGDRIGIKFYSNVRRELAVVGYKVDDLVFNAVCGDYICADTPKGCIKIIYHCAHLIIGEVCETGIPTVFVEGKYNREFVGNIEIQDTQDGEFTALLHENNKFAFAFGKTREDVIDKVKYGITVNIKEAEEKKKAYYKENCISGKYEQLYAKCLSVMKTQLYSPEGQYDTIWSTPDRLPHKYIWIWDSVFHAVGFRNVNPKIAEDLILAVFCNLREDGFIPCRSVVGFDHPMISKETQSPIIAWGAWLVYQVTKNKDFLEKVFNCNAKFLDWCFKNRMSRADLFAWHVDEDNILCKCGESGMDNSPRFDDAAYLLAIDFSCFMANEMRFMSKMANELGMKTEQYDSAYEKIKKSINEILWDEETGFYYDYDTEKERLHKVKSVASFLPLFAGVCDEDKAKKLVTHLTNPNEFYTEFPIPSISVDDPTYGIDMWKGPVWINFNYMIAEGLTDYGYNNIAEDITEKTIKVVNEWYEKTGTVFEFYDSSNKIAPNRLKRKGEPVEPYNIDVRVQTIRDYGWSICLVCDFIKTVND